MTASATVTPPPLETQINPENMQPVPTPIDATDGYTYQRVDGTIEQASSAEDAIARCPVLGEMPVEEANVLLELSAIGSEKIAEEARHIQEDQDEFKDKVFDFDEATQQKPVEEPAHVSEPNSVAQTDLAEDARAPVEENPAWEAAYQDDLRLEQMRQQDIAEQSITETVDEIEVKQPEEATQDTSDDFTVGSEASAIDPRLTTDADTKEYPNQKDEDALSSSLGAEQTIMSSERTAPTETKNNTTEEEEEEEESPDQVDITVADIEIDDSDIDKVIFDEIEVSDPEVSDSEGDDFTYGVVEIENEFDPYRIAFETDEQAPLDEVVETDADADAEEQLDLQFAPETEVSDSEGDDFTYGVVEIENEFDPYGIAFETDEQALLDGVVEIDADADADTDSEEQLDLQFAAETLETYEMLLELSAAEVEIEEEIIEDTKTQEDSFTEELDMTQDFETLVASETDIEEAEESLTLEVILEQASEQPLDETLSQLAVYPAETAIADNSQHENFKKALNDLKEVLPDSYTEYKSEDSRVLITPEVTKELLNFLRVLGYKQPQDELLKFVGKHDITFLFRVLSYISYFNEDNNQEFLFLANASTSSDDYTRRIRLMKALSNFIIKNNFEH